MTEFPLFPAYQLETSDKMGSVGFNATDVRLAFRVKNKDLERVLFELPNLMAGLADGHS